MRKFRMMLPGVVVLGLVVAGGTAAIAQLGSDQPKKSLNKVDTHIQAETAASTNDPAPMVEAAQTSGQAEIRKTDRCGKTVTKTEETSSSNSVNSKHTIVHCENHSASGSTSVEITNNIQQSATTGESTGQSGTASNDSTTGIDIDL